LKDKESIEAMSRLVKSGSGAVTFDVPSGSTYGGKLAIFYAQAAAFGAFLEARSCKGRQVYGQLLSTLDRGQDLDRWLRSNGTRLCLPNSAGAFERSFSLFIARWTGRTISDVAPDPQAKNIR
jgi:hypothetical protein